MKLISVLAWQRTTLILECLANVCAIGALVACLISVFNKKWDTVCSITSGVLSIVATILAVSAISVFAINAMSDDNVTLMMGTTHYEVFFNIVLILFVELFILLLEALYFHVIYEAFDSQSFFHFLYLPASQVVKRERVRF